MRFKVPQNIDMPDRIVGPLTMVQFIYAVIGFGLCYIIYSSSLPSPLNLILAAPIGLFVICLDFVKINERPFIIFFLSAIQYLSNPKQRIWHQGDGSDLTVEIYHTEKQAMHIQQKHISADEIAAMARQYDTVDNQLIKK